MCDIQTSMSLGFLAHKDFTLKLPNPKCTLITITNYLSH